MAQLGELPGAALELGADSCLCFLTISQEYCDAAI